MEMCSICKKNIATIYTAKVENGKTKMVGICLECAKKMGMPIMDQFMKQVGITEEDMDNLTEQMNNVIQDSNIEDLTDNNFLMNVLNGIFPDEKKEEDKDSNLDSLEFDKEKILDKKDSSEKSDVKTKKGFLNKKKNKYLDKYGINLTNKAKENKIDKVIGRNREIDRVIQILNRRNKNNPILIGEPGVGKTAIAEGLAVRIAEKNVPAKLFDVEVYLLDLTAVVAGTQFRGQFEGRMKSIIDEAKKNGNVILVIDEVHNIMGAGEAQGGSMNAANILKPALARGEIQVIGATTLDEYRKYIEKDSALERRFQPVLVEEPTVEETIEILQGIKSYYEEYHQVKISNDVIESAVNLSQRYINDRFLPDKAIDVIDEASSRANLKNKGLIELKSLEDELKKIQEEKQIAAEGDNYEKAAEYKVEECRLKEKIKEIKKESMDVVLTTQDIAFVIEAWTKIPVQRITEEEGEKLINLEDRLHKRVIGQNEGVKSLAKAIRRNRLGFTKKKKPSSFIFVGPTGVGKTELVKALAGELFGNEDALIRVDMSEYMEKHTVSKLIGAPPGYVGHDDGGQLTEKVRRKPYSVILLDEIEKAHPDVFNMLLQILEDGRLTDSQGRTVSFEHTVIIMTSNVGTNFKADSIGFNQEGYDAMESRVKEALRETFRPEFINRIDEIIVFNSLNKGELYKIIDLMFEEVKEEVKVRKINLDIDDSAKDFILKVGYDKKYGARPLRRAIQRHIEDEIAEAYLLKKIKEGSNIKVKAVDGKIVLE
ncbi:ATP-dependent Clp protease ATP-binding subunit [Clostridium botulinum]|uniref:ABC transporter ATPase n=2 Tax=Clostridium botulinum TaxID=1491 RepID=A0A0A0IGS7_CLOBO|nr:ATP-dependent Clp protease ATP-binding subunit [Clostridium botulinum]KGM98735.1 ABC transporter ATPase [Clostridium botulinum C/D str. DC5]KOC55131.1 ABC transporter ATPase [Clostridium botulinum]KOC55384.1 ABC transporter ATPase [Clostridium botulinum]MCD3234488.1 ATP-dependent Clp protease ATP-binding subunit [Clostridium botulinum D/C]MCD3240384.1 ATP-dependent Clp protease ATP-binding subunit [Clostridium botulinum D/C]